MYSTYMQNKDGVPWINTTSFFDSNYQLSISVYYKYQKDVVYVMNSKGHIRPQ
jgi:hypothetical protein